MTFLTFIPSNYQWQNNNIYTSKTYIDLLKDEVKSFYMVDEQHKKVLALIHFQIKEKTAISLINAPFGGFEFYTKLPSTDLKRFLAFITEDLKQQNIEKTVIKMPPEFYSNEINHGFNRWLLTNKFKTSLKEINHHINISNLPFEKQLNSMEKRKYKKCNNANFVFKKEPSSQFSEVYLFIKKCRSEKGQNLSMSMENLQEMIQSFPDSYYLFAVYDNQKMIAASICLRVNYDLIYNFYPASRLAYNKYSPMVFLIANIYSFAQEHDFKILDLGTSMLNNLPNENLIRFKENIGGKATQRQILELDL